jgi:ATP/maltotriose-dependent transcriptional regulator MalT
MKGDEAVPPKLARPRLEHIHPRVDLLSLLDQLRTAPLIIVSGPPGVGKRGLVASYAQTRNLPSLWYHIDHSDEDLVNFFHHLDIATHNFISLKKTDLPTPSFGCLRGDTEALNSYFRDLYRCMFTPFLMVFDDYHRLSANAPLHKVVREGCAVLPVGGRISLIAENDSPPAVIGLRANRAPLIIGWQELQRHPDKIKEVAALQDLTLPLEDIIKQLRKRAGDWAAELVMSLQPLLT